MQAVVLVGGEGTRLRPLTLETPKPMVPIMNMPFLERTLRRLKEAGIDDVILPSGYLPDAITSYFGDGSRLGLRVRYVIEETLLGTAGATVKASAAVAVTLGALRVTAAASGSSLVLSARFVAAPPELRRVQAA